MKKTCSFGAVHTTVAYFSRKILGIKRVRPEQSRLFVHTDIIQEPLMNISCENRIMC